MFLNFFLRCVRELSDSHVLDYCHVGLPETDTPSAKSTYVDSVTSFLIRERNVIRSDLLAHFHFTRDSVDESNSFRS